MLYVDALLLHFLPRFYTDDSAFFWAKKKQPECLFVPGHSFFLSFSLFVRFRSWVSVDVPVCACCSFAVFDIVGGSLHVCGVLSKINQSRAHLTRNYFSRQKKKLNFVYLNEFMIYNFSLIISFLYILVISFMKIFSIN